MSKIKIIRYFLCFIFLFTMLGGLVSNQVVLAAQQDIRDTSVLPPGQEEPPVEETLELESKFPILSDKSGEIFEFAVELKYLGSERKRLDRPFTTPTDWTANVVSG